MAAGQAGAAVAADGEADDSRVLIVYYSHSGVTQGIAERLQKHTGGVLFRVELVEPYPEDDQALRAQSRKEVEEGVLPDIQDDDLPDMDDYDLALIGGPVWFGTLAPPLSTFLAQVDLEGKTVAPFCTYGGGAGGYFEKFAEAMPEDVTLLEGFGLGRVGNMAEEDIEKAVAEWVAKLPVPEDE
jgi:flavodoxin